MRERPLARSHHRVTAALGLVGSPRRRLRAPRRDHDVPRVARGVAPRRAGGFSLPNPRLCVLVVVCATRVNRNQPRTCKQGREARAGPGSPLPPPILDISHGLDERRGRAAPARAPARGPTKWWRRPSPTRRRRPGSRTPRPLSGASRGPTRARTRASAATRRAAPRRRATPTTTN